MPLELRGGQLASGNSGFAYRSQQNTGDMEAYFTVAIGPNNNSAQVVFICLQDAGTTGFDGYSLSLTTGLTGGQTLRIREYLNGNPTDLATRAGSVGAGDKLMLRRVGSMLQAWQYAAGAWAQKFQFIDTSPLAASGKIGVQVASGSIDDFGGTGSTTSPPTPPTIPSTIVLDDFERAPETPVSQGGAWSATTFAGGNGLKLANNHLEYISGSGSAVRAQEFTGDLEAFGTISTVPQNGNGLRVFVGARETGSSAVDGYSLRLHKQIGGFLWSLERWTNGAVAVLGQWQDGSFAVGDKMLVRRVGTKLEAWLYTSGSWTKRQQATDSTHPTGGKIGAEIVDGGFGGVPTLDDFGGGTIGGPPSGPPPPAQSNGTFCGSGKIALTATCTLSDPVNTLTGWFVTQVQDVSLPGTGVTLDWTRSYTSGDPTVGPLGPGWTHPYAASLSIEGDGDVTARGEEGQQLFFSKQGDGSYVGAAGALATLSLTAGVYTLVRNDQVSYTFDAQGVLTSLKDRNNQGLTFAYTSGRLSSITDAAGRQTTLTYNGSNLLSQVSLQDGRSVGYGYTNGRLTSVTDVRGKTWTYTYDGGGRLATIVDPLNHTEVTNVYGANGRVTQQTDATNKTTTFAWDEPTQTATVTDPKNHVWKDVYANGVLLKRIDGANNETEFGHDADLNETSVEGPTGETTSMTYDASGNLLTATAPPSLNNVQKTLVYNGRNDPTQVTDARGKVSTYGYDGSGNTTSVTHDGQTVAGYTYDGQGRVLTSTDGNGKTTTYGYDANGNVNSVTEPDPDGGGQLPAPVTTYTYDARGFMLTRVDPLGNVQGGNPSQHTTSFTYNAAGQLLTETNQLGHVTTNVYDDAGRLTSTTDASNHTTTYTYDNANRLLTETGPDPDGGGSLQAPVTTYTYDDAGIKLTETDPRGNTTTFAYDNANRLVSTTAPDPDGGGPLPAPVTTQTWDANSNLASVVEPRGNVSGANPNDYRTSYIYDAAGRLRMTTDPLGNVTTNSYDAVGNLASVQDADNHTTAYTYDAQGRILTVTAPDPDGGGPLAAPVTTHTYDGAGNELTRTDANNHTTTYAYDGISRRVSETGPDPDGGGPQTAPVTTFAYDANGNRTVVTDPNGNATGTVGDGQTTHGYDRANRLTSINYSDTTPDVTFTYDNAGNRLSMVDGPGTQTRTYDNLDRLLTVTRGTSTFSYQYDAAGNVTKRTYPDGTVVDYTYDPLSRMVSVVNSTKTVAYAYDAASNLVTTTLPSQNGYVETRTYDRARRLTGVKSVKGASTLIDVNYTRDAVGNPLQETTTGAAPVTKTFGYDNMDRLTSVCFQAGTCPGGSDPFIRWTYDGVGNRLTQQRPTGTTGYTYDARDRLLSAGSTSYTYNQNGNQLSAGSRTFTWDLANRLKTTTLAPTTTTYTYDGDGVRTQASTGTTNQLKTNFIWDVNHTLPQVARESNGGGGIYRRYFHGLALLWMSTLESNSNAFYFHYDPLGSVRNITAQGGTTQWTYDYEPFGATRTQTGSTPTNLVKFTGEYEDPTGLYHLRARQYDPVSGRFMRPDPVDSDADSTHVSVYAYSANRPTSLVDPSGETFRPAQAGQMYARHAASVVGPNDATACQAETCGGPVQRIRFAYPIPARYNSSVGWAAPHNTGDLPGYPAYDFFAASGTPVVAVEKGRIRAYGSSGGDIDGDALYLLGESGFDYWYGHIRRSVPVDRPVRRGQVIGRIADHPNGDHLHLGVNTNIGGRIIGPQRFGSDDPKDFYWQRGRAVMRMIGNARRV